MKVKFVKNYLSYKADQVVEDLDEIEAQELITAKKAEEVKVEPKDELMDSIDLRIAQVSKDSYKLGRKEAKAEMTESFKNRQSIMVGDDNILGHPTAGFRNLGEYAVQNMKFYTNNGPSDNYRASTLR